jgi:hypothetical protein
MVLLLVFRKNYKASWLLNYRGGSFLLPDAQTYARNVKLEALALKCFQMVKKLVLDEIVHLKTWKQ